MFESLSERLSQSLRSITGKHQTDWSQSQGNVLTQPGLIIGEADGVISVCDRAGQPTGVTYDRDSGLYVGNLLGSLSSPGIQAKFGYKTAGQ